MLDLSFDAQTLYLRAKSLSKVTAVLRIVMNHTRHMRAESVFTVALRLNPSLLSNQQLIPRFVTLLPEINFGLETDVGFSADLEDQMDDPFSARKAAGAMEANDGSEGDPEESKHGGALCQKRWWRRQKRRDRSYRFQRRLEFWRSTPVTSV